MKLFILFLLVNTALGSNDYVELTKEDKADLIPIVDSINKFAVNLGNEVGKTVSGNAVVSPLSAQIALALAYTGAGGATASELKSLLSLPNSLNQTLSEYHSLIHSLQGGTLKLANSMFVDSSLQLKKDFQTNAQKYFLSLVKSTEFTTDPELSRVLINLWVKNQTNKKIKNLLEPGSINQDTRLVLVNAIHFKDEWVFKFDKENTREEPFHVSKTETKPVQMMNIQNWFRFSNSILLKSKILELKYMQSGFSMVIILPDEIDGIAELEAKLNKVDLPKELKKLTDHLVNVTLPKFKLEQTIDFKDILKPMGVKTMFDHSAADFRNLSKDNLYVTKMIQKAFVEVNEQGTEAAAATGMVFSTLSGRVSYITEMFLADHPFVFLIVTNDFPIFIGRVVRPN